VTVPQIKDTRWWRYETPHTDIFDIIRRICTRTSVRRQMDLYHSALYDDSELTGLGPTSWMQYDYEPSKLAFNVIRQTVDTLCAKISKNQPLPTPVTSGGNWQQKRRAQKMGKAIQGQFELSGVWRMSPTIARDTGLYGTGITHNYRVGKTIYHERVFPWEVVVDPREAMYGKPRSFYVRRWVDKYVLIERFPEFEQQILECDNKEVEVYDLGYDDTCDLVLVVEAYHLSSRDLEDRDPDYESDAQLEESSITDQPDPRRDEDGPSEASGPKRPAHDGCHIICIGNATLLKEPWRRQYFPFSVLRMGEPLVGWFGTGLAKQLTGLQYTINETASVVQEAHALTGGYILVEDGSNVDTDKIDNGRGTILKYNGTRPDWINPQPVHPDTWNFILGLIPKAFEMTGVSQLSAQSQKPPGIESAVALNTFNDIETERFSMFARAYEEYHIDVAWQFFDLWEEIANEYGTTSIKVQSRDRGQRILKELDYKQIRLDRESFVLDVFPTSLLSKKPAARIEELESFINAGWLTREDAMMLLEMPDLERAGNLILAATRIIEQSIDKMLDADDPSDPDVYTYPEPSFNLKLCISKGIQMYLDAKLDGCPDENLQLVLQFITDAKDLLQPPAPTATPTVPGGGAPDGAPGPAGPAPVGGAPSGPPAGPGPVPMPGGGSPPSPLDNAPAPSI
jgi:hypothetical protein